MFREHPRKLFPDLEVWQPVNPDTTPFDCFFGPALTDKEKSVGWTRGGGRASESPEKGEAEVWVLGFQMSVGVGEAPRRVWYRVTLYLAGPVPQDPISISLPFKSKSAGKWGNREPGFSGLRADSLPHTHHCDYGFTAAGGAPVKTCAGTEFVGAVTASAFVVEVLAGT